MSNDINGKQPEEVVLQTPIEEMETIVAAEIEAFSEKYSDRAEKIPGWDEYDNYTSQYLGNFFKYIARDRGRRLDSFIDMDWGDLTFKEYFERVDQEPEGKTEFLLSRTLSQLRTDIDYFVERYNVDVDRIEQMISQCHKEKSRIPLIEITEMILPVYIGLRAMGYGHRDMIG